MIITWSSISYRILLVILKITLDASYIYFIYPVFGYSGFSLSLDMFSYTESWLLYLLVISFMKYQLLKPSDFLTLLFFLFAIAPMLTLYGLSEQNSLYTYFSILVFFFILLIQTGPPIRIPYIKHGALISVIISFSVILLALSKMASSGAMFRLNFDLSKVYEYREETGSVLNEGLWGYIIPWTSKIFSLFLLSYALFKKQYTIVICLIVFQILLFGITSHKAVAVYPAFALGLYMFRNSEYILLWILASIITLLFICLSTYYIFDSGLLPSLFLRRVFFVPALLKYNYFEFFNNNGFVYWSNSITSSFVNYPFHLPPARLIASTFYGTAEMNANTGFIATSYMHSGFPGMLFIGFLVAILFKITDAFSTGGKPTWFYLSFLSVPFFNLFSSAAFFTTLLTHGLAVGLMLAWISYNRHESKE